MHTLALLLLLAAEPEPSKLSATVSLGSSHWVGQTFGTPIGMSTPGFAIAVRPGLRWLEVGVRYSLAVQVLPLPGGSYSRVGFIGIEAALVKELRVADQRLSIGAGPAAAIIHSGLGAGWGIGPVLFARWLIDVGERLGIGPFFAMRPVFYTLPGDATLLGRQDLQADLGVTATF